MFEQRTLIHRLEYLKANSYLSVNKIQQREIMRLMLKWIGARDSYLRDDLIYDVFAHWIPMNMVTNAECIEILNIVLDNQHLFYKIDKFDYRHSFTRTFSLLIIALILERDLRNGSFLEAGKVLETLAKLLEYYARESVLQGYYENEGWAHSMAHAADAFAMVVQHESVDKTNVIKILNIVRDKIGASKHYYINCEDERSAAIIRNAYSSGKIDETELNKWVNSFLAIPKEHDVNRSQIKKGNIRNLLRSVYFIIDNKEVRMEIEKTLLTVKYS